MKRLLAISLAAIVLTGCATAELVPEPTADEVAALDARVRDLQWQGLQLPPNATRPDVEKIEYIDPDRTDETYAACMEDAGYLDWEPASIGAFGGPSSAERVDLFVCVSMYPVAPSYYGLYTQPQREAVYEYYRESLVPCLEASGVDVLNPPTEVDFVAMPGGFGPNWSPYSYLDTSISMAEAQSLFLACPDLSTNLFAPGE